MLIPTNSNLLNRISFTAAKGMNSFEYDMFLFLGTARQDLHMQKYLMYLESLIHNKVQETKLDKVEQYLNNMGYYV